jgi:S-formylglutathione hydrolase
LQIYLDASDHDMFLLNEATEYLHRLSTDNGVEHEYHLVHGADHVGQSLVPRNIEGLAFLTRVFESAPAGSTVSENHHRAGEEKYGIK